MRFVLNHFLLLTCCGIGTLLFADVYAQDEAEKHHPQRFLIKYKNSVDQQPHRVRSRHRHIKDIKPLFDHSDRPVRSRLSKSPKHRELDRWHELSIADNANWNRTFEQLSKDPDIEFVEPDFVVNTDAVPTDPSFGQLWGLVNTGQAGGSIGNDIGVENAWTSASPGDGVVVAVVDTGVDYTHKDLADNIWKNTNEIPDNGIDDDGNGYIDDVRGYDFVNNDPDPFDDNQHGTHVAGTIAAVANNDEGIVGVAWSSKIMVVKSLSSSGGGLTSNNIRAIQYAIDNGANIINTSWGSSGYSQLLYDVISAANDAGISVVAASGNSAVDTEIIPHYPASFNLPNIIGVSSFDRYGRLSSVSNWGKNSVHVSAPGSSIYSTIPGNFYRNLSGTSMATPHVAGAAALILADDFTRTPEQIKQLLISTSTFTEPLNGKTISNGRINVTNALNCQAGALQIIPTSHANNFKIPSDQPQIFKAKIYSCDKQINNVQLVMRVNNEIDVGLNDAGIQGDELAGDGIYSATWNPHLNGDVTLVFSASHPYYASATKSLNGSIYVKTEYQIDDTISYNWQDASSGTPLNLSNDSNTLFVFGFPFEFYNTIYDRVYVSSNGIMSFAKSTSSYSNTAIPNNNAPNNFIAPFWTDLNPDFGGNIYVMTSGVQPNRKFIVSWDDVHVNNDQIPNGGSFQVILAEGSSQILFQYKDVIFNSTDDNGNNATVGIENIEGTKGVQYSHNTPSINNNMAIQFKPIRRPTATAGGPYQSEVDQAVNFTSTVSSPLAGAIFTYSWDFGDGSSSTEPHPTHTYSQRGIFEVTLVVNDGNEDSLPALTSVVVGSNLSPIAHAGGPYTGFAQQNIAFDGSQSSDQDGDALSYLWDFGDGSNGFGIFPSHTYAAPGNYIVTLVVHDGFDTSAPATASVSVENQAPVAVIDAPSRGAANIPIHFSASSSHDPDLQTLTYSWDFGDGQSLSLENPSHEFSSTGLFTVTLTVSDGALTDSVQHQIEIVTNTQPVADPGGPYQEYVGNSITFDGSGSFDADGDALTYVWGFGDGNSANGIAPTHTYANKGSYNLSLLVNDGLSDSQIANTTVTVPNRAPTAKITSQVGDKIDLGLFAIFSGTSSFDPDGDSLSYSWKVNGTHVSTAANYSRAFSQYGNFSITLTVSDGDEDSLPAERVLRVITPPISNAGELQVYSPDETAELNGDNSSDIDGRINTYAWQQTFGPTVEVINSDASRASFVVPSSSVFWKTVSAGTNHTCAIDSEQAMWCWGSNAFRQIKQNSSTTATAIYPSPESISIDGNSHWREVSSGGRHTCAISVDDRLFCWGDNSFGQLGIGNNGAYQEVVTQDNVKWRTVSAGEYHTCAIDVGEKLYCWGDNSVGKLGLGDTLRRETPEHVDSPTGTGWKSVDAATSHTCAQDTLNTLWCWGSNSSGQIGIDATTTEQTQPAKVPTPSQSTYWKTFSVGESHSCAKSSIDGNLYCWGEIYIGGIATPNSTSNIFTPAQVITEHDYVQISSGNGFNCALATSKQVYCWGRNPNGENGTGNLPSTSAPTNPILFNSHIALVSSGKHHSCVLTDLGSIACWGENAYNKVAPDSLSSHKSPVFAARNDNLLGFQLTVTDDDGLTSTDNTNIVINQRPIAVTPGYVSSNQNLNIVINGSASYDAELSDISYAWRLGGELISTDPVLTHTFAEAGEYSVQLTVNDGYTDSLASSTTVFINTMPTAQDDNVTVLEDKTLVIDVLANDSDESLDSIIIGFSQPSHGYLTLESNRFSYTPIANYSGPDSFEYTVTDAMGLQSTANVLIDVIAVNDVPEINNLALQTQEDAPVSGILVAHDVDSNDISFTIHSPPQNGKIEGLNTNTGEFTFVPAANFSGTIEFEALASDGIDNSLPAKVKIDVLAINDSPVAADDYYVTLEGQNLKTGNVLGNDTDVDGDVLMVLQLEQPQNGTAYSNNDGTFTYTPNEGYTGEDSFSYTISDGHQGRDDAIVHITVNPYTDETPISPVVFNIEDLLLDIDKEKHVFRIKPEAPPINDITLRYYTTDGSAELDSEFGAIEGSLHWASGDATEREIPIPLLKNKFEHDLHFNLVFVVESGYAIFENGSLAVITIPKNNPGPKPKKSAISFSLLIFILLIGILRGNHQLRHFRKSSQARPYNPTLLSPESV
ncbi:MAG: PKD domain-containing protein [Gammaproteobacteria bacterium]|nr:PKD domain-containing protein [Gammaproteobacteria bacterium]